MDVEKHPAGTTVYLKNMPIAILDSGAVGKTYVADMKLTGRKVHPSDMAPFAEKTLTSLGEIGILLNGVQRNRYCFRRSDHAYFDVVTNNIKQTVKGTDLVAVATPTMAHEPFFCALIPHPEDGQVIHIFTDNYVTLLLRRLMRGMGCTKQVIVGGWSSAPYGTCSESVNGFVFPHVGIKYQVITLRDASLPVSDIDAFMESARYLPCIDTVTQGEDPSAGNTVLDISFTNINPVIHVPATILGVSTMENWGVVFSGHDETTYSMYSRDLGPSICEVQYQFYEEGRALAREIGASTPSYNYRSFFSRRSMLAQEYVGLDGNGKDNAIFPLDQPSNGGDTDPNDINHHYLTEDVPVGYKICHDLEVQYGVPTPIVDSMIILAGAMHKKSFFEISKYNLAYLRINNMPKEEPLAYLNKGVYSH